MPDLLDACPNGTTSTGLLGLGCADGCASGYAVNRWWTFCHDVNECASSGVGTSACLVGSGGSCVNAPGSYTCGACPAGFAKAGDGKSCGDVNECADVGATTCLVSLGGTCTNSVGSYACGTCPAGFAKSADGKLCENVDECASGGAGAAACLVSIGGACSDQYGSYACASCPGGYAPDATAHACGDVDECAGVGQGTCLVAQGGACTNSVGSYACTTCPAGFAPSADGRACANVDECAPGGIGEAACLVPDGGACEDAVGSYACRACPDGYVLAASAAHCEPNPLPNRDAIVHAMRRVNENWMVKNQTALGDRGWARATYFEGNMEMYDAYPDAMYLNYALKWANGHAWTLYQGATTRHADNQCIGQTYFDLYRIDPQPIRLQMIETSVRNMMATSVINDWWWVDALHMAMPVFAQFAVLRDDPAFSERMYAMYDWTKRGEGGGLYDTSRGLWWRDATFITRRAPNGQPVFWSRGNGWVFAAHARTIEKLDEGDTVDPHREEYVQTFVEMAEALAAIQQPSGFWAANLLDASAPAGPETSGTAFFVYGLAWGVNHGFLDEATYLPIIARGWSALTSVAIGPRGMLGYIQPVGVGPAATTTPNDNHDFGVGAFLLAGSEVLELSHGPMPATVSSRNLAIGRPVTASSQQVGNEARGAVDNDLSTRWSAEVYPQWLRVDLGSARTIRKIEVVALEQRAYRFVVEGSVDGTNWTMLVNDAANAEGATFLERPLAAPATARYVRLTVLGLTGNTSPWTSIVDFRVLE